MRKNPVRLMAEYDLSAVDYHSTLRALRANQFEVEVAETQWGDMYDDLVTEAMRDIERMPGERPIIIGHGKGGNLAMRALYGEERDLGGLILASPGTMCADAMTRPQAKQELEEHFPSSYDRASICRFSIAQLARHIPLRSEQVIVLVGGLEVEAHPYMGELAEITAEAFGTEVITVPDAPHLIELSPQYSRAVSTAALLLSEAA